MPESTQHKLDRVRKPRVHITYDVEIGDAQVEKELPFVLGILGDYSGKPVGPLPELKDRKFVEIDRDNFNKVLAGMAPRLAFRVDDKLTNDPDKKLPVELKFESMDDFSPENVAAKIEPLRDLLEIRNQLKDLLYRLDGNDKLEANLAEIIANTEKKQSVAKALGIADASADGEGK